MFKFDLLYDKIILQNKLTKVQLSQLNSKNKNDLNLFLKGVNLAAKASNNDLWNISVFNDLSQLYPTRKWIFLQLNNDKIGTLSYRVKDSVIFLSCFAIFQQYQGLGLGYRSMLDIIDYFKNLYPNMKIQLNVAKINNKAFNLYKKCKFKLCKQLPTKFTLEI